MVLRDNDETVAEMNTESEHQYSFCAIILATLETITTVKFAGIIVHNTRNGGNSGFTEFLFILRRL